MSTPRSILLPGAPTASIRTLGVPSFRTADRGGRAWLKLKYPPYSWAGRQVRAAIVEESGYSDYGAPLPLAAVYRVGTLEAVNDLGIVATLRYFDLEDAEQEEPPVSTFYPWSSVVWLRLAERR